MKTLRRFLYKEILTAVAFVTVAFLALFFFFDFGMIHQAGQFCIFTQNLCNSLRLFI